jgi:hypothetical protein
MHDYDAGPAHGRTAAPTGNLKAATTSKMNKIKNNDMQTT